MANADITDTLRMKDHAMDCIFKLSLAFYRSIDHVSFNLVNICLKDIIDVCKMEQLDSHLLTSTGWRIKHTSVPKSAYEISKPEIYREFDCIKMNGGVILN